jgi:hypothetical protein
MSIDAGDACGKGSVSGMGSIGAKASISGEGSDRLTDRGEREMQRRQEERMPGVPVREWVRALVTRRSAARADGGLVGPRSAAG